jgi:hypothetical protein
MPFKGGPGTVKNIFSMTYGLWYISAFQMAVSTVYFMLFPWTRKIVHTYFASPATYGLLTSDWFGLEWYIQVCRPFV